MREHRLVRRADFVAVYGAGRRLYSKNFIVFVLRRETVKAGTNGAPRPQGAKTGPSQQGTENEMPPQGAASGALPQGGPDTWRMGLAVTRKTGVAVVRNRIKRVLREFFRLHGTTLPPDLDIVVTPKRSLDPGCVTLAFVERELAPVLRQAAHCSGQGKAWP